MKTLNLLFFDGQWHVCVSYNNLKKWSELKLKRDKKVKLTENLTFKWQIKGNRSSTRKRIEVAGY